VLRALRKLALVDANIVGLIVNREGQLSVYGYGNPRAAGSAVNGSHG
jgi:hypothetical protein